MVLLLAVLVNDSEIVLILYDEEAAAEVLAVEEMQAVQAIVMASLAVVVAEIIATMVEE